MPRLSKSSSNGSSSRSTSSKLKSPSSRAESGGKSSTRSASRALSKAKESKETEESIASNDHFNIIEILLLDHTYLKDCIDVLRDEKEDPKVKLKYGKGFLDALEKHSTGEKKALYAPLQEVEDLRSQILESIIEHGIVDDKVKKLSKKLTSARGLDEDMEAELKVLADIVEHHLEEEEDELFPKMRKDIDAEILNQMGYQFMVLRQFTEKDLEDAPELQDEMEMISQEKIPVKNFINVTHEYFNRL
jgi:hemerythrin-like domain-containing protein